MRSKKTSRYRAAHQDDEDGILGSEETKEEQTKSLSRSSNVKVVDAVHLLLYEKSELLLPYLDKHGR